MKSLEAEWQHLRSNLTDEQAKDGRRCFYCGVLAVLDDVLRAGGRVHPEYVFARETEIRRALNLGATRESTPEPDQGA